MASIRVDVVVDGSGGRGREGGCIWAAGDEGLLGGREPPTGTGDKERGDRVEAEEEEEEEDAVSNS